MTDEPVHNKPFAAAPGRHLLRRRFEVEVIWTAARDGEYYRDPSDAIGEALSEVGIYEIRELPLEQFPDYQGGTDA